MVPGLYHVPLQYLLQLSETLLQWTSQSNLEEEGSEDSDAPLNYCDSCKKDYCMECDKLKNKTCFGAEDFAETKKMLTY